MKCSLLEEGAAGLSSLSSSPGLEPPGGST
jgi:hypothetical protein